MKSYSELTQKERSQLTQEEFEHYCNIQLMEVGIVRPKEPILEEIPKPPKMPMESGFRLTHCSEGYTTNTSIVFKTEKDATAFMNFKGLKIIVYNYDSKQDCLTPFKEGGIMPINLPSQETMKIFSSELKLIRDIQDRNTSKIKEYNDKQKQVANALKDLIDNYSECKDIGENYKEIIKVYKEYVSLAQNNESIALEFLKKAYSDTEVQEAFQWENEPIPEEKEEPTQEIVDYNIGRYSASLEECV